MLPLLVLVLATRWSVAWGRNVSCGLSNGANSTLDECLTQLQPLLGNNQVAGLPKSKQDVDTLCAAFKTGMGCVDAYSAACLSPRERRVLHEHTVGARLTFRFLCDDSAFQKEYLQHKSCFRSMTKDWDSCSLSFMGLVQEELARNNRSHNTRLIELCCAKFGFLRCVFVSSRYKCDQKAAEFLHKMADTLASARLFSSKCVGVNEAVCAGASAAHAHLPLPPLLLLPPFVALLIDARG